MAVTADPFVAADLAATIPEVWTSLVQEELFAKTCGANFFLDLSSYASAGGDIVHVPGVFTNAFTVNTQSTQGAEITTEGPAMDDITLTINTHKYIATIVGDKDLAQIAKMYSFNEIYAKKMGGSLATALEASIFGLWSGLTTNSIGDTATVLSDAEIRQGIAALATGNFPHSELGFFFHPYVYWNQLGAVTKYYDASQTGWKSGLVADGNFGKMDASRGLVGELYGIPVYTSTNVVSGLQTHRNLLAHKDALAFAIQTPGANKVRIQTENAVRNLGMLTVADILYGVTEVRDAGAVVLNASSAFIGS